MPLKEQCREGDPVVLKSEICGDPEKLREALRTGNSRVRTWLYPFVIKFLSQLDIRTDEAAEHFYRIQGHMAEMDARLGRNVGVRVALLDYFHNVAGEMVNPRVIEHKLLESLIEKTKEDPKTGCCNAAYFNDLVTTELKRADRYDQKCSLILLDIDDFKDINDTFGHLCGDEVLCRFTDILKSGIRTEDSVGRFGGDEFALLLPQTGRVGARCLAERVRQSLADYFEEYSCGGKKIDVTFSGGIATYPYDGNCYEALVEVADTGLYRSKALGKNHISDNLGEEDVQPLIISEKRQFRRFRPIETREFWVENSMPLINLKARVVNISSGGVLLECDPEINREALKDVFNLQLSDYTESEGKPFQLCGKVVRYTQGAAGIRIAVSFEKELSEDVWDGLSRITRLIPV